MEYKGGESKREKRSSSSGIQSESHEPPQLIVIVCSFAVREPLHATTKTSKLSILLPKTSVFSPAAAKISEEKGISPPPAASRC